MASVNKWIGIGNLGRDPEIKYLPSGDAVCNISIACTDSYKDKNTGEKKEVTEWVRIVFFGKLAEIAGKYLNKGSQVYIEGSLRTRKYQKDGQDHYATEVKGDEMKMLGGKPDGGDRQPERTPSAPQQRSAQGAQPTGGGFNEMEDDIPF